MHSRPGRLTGVGTCGVRDVLSCTGRRVVFERVSLETAGLWIVEMTQQDDQHSEVSTVLIELLNKDTHRNNRNGRHLLRSRNLVVVEDRSLIVCLMRWLHS